MAADKTPGLTVESTEAAPAMPKAAAREISVAQLVTTMARGGAQLTVLESIDVGDHEGLNSFSMTVLAGSDRPDDGDFWTDDRLAGATVVEVPPLRRRVSPRHDLAALIWLIRWLRRHRPDVLHTHSTKAGVLGRLAAAITRTPVVHTVHGWSGPFYRGHPVVRRAVALLERLLARLSSALIVVGTGDREIGLRNGIGDVEKYRVVRSGIHLSQVTPDRDRLRRDLGIRPDDLIVGMVARFAEQKDHNLALEAMSHLTTSFPSAKLVLVGDGPTRPDVERQVAELELDDVVVLAGHRPNAGELAHAFDVCLLTSFWEGVPRTLVEAAAAGVPLVASDVGGVADIVVDGETGWLVPVGDLHTVINRLERLLSSSDLREQMGRAAANQAAGFSVEQMRRDVQAVWAEVARIDT